MSATSRGKFLLVLLGAIAIISAGVRLGSLTIRPLTWDEMAVIRWGNDGIEELVQNVAREDAHPPLSYIGQEFIRRISQPVTGTTIALRLFSSLCGLGGALLLYIFARRRAGQVTALLAATLLLLNPQHFHASTTGRMYAVAVFFILVSLLLLDRAAESGKKRDGILAGFFCLATGLIHYYTLVIIPVILFFVPREKFRHLILPGSLIFWGMLPWALLASSSPLHNSANFSSRLTAWLMTTPTAALGEGIRLLDFDFLFTGIPGLAVVVLLCTALFRQESRPAVLALLVPALSLALLSSILHMLYGSWTLQGAQLVLLAPFLALVLAIAATRCHKLKSVLIPLLLLFSILACVRYHVGQQALPGLKMLTTGLQGMVIVVDTYKEAMEVSANTEAIPLIREPGHPDDPYPRLNLAYQGITLPPRKSPAIIIKGDPDIIFSTTPEISSMTLNLPAIYWPFKRAVDHPGHFSADGQTLRLDGPWTDDQVIQISVLDPDWFDWLKVPGWCLLIVMVCNLLLPLKMTQPENKD